MVSAVYQAVIVVCAFCVLCIQQSGCERAPCPTVCCVITPDLLLLCLEVSSSSSSL